MRKLWPPTYDDFSIRIWATIVSAIVSLLLWAFFVFGSETAFLILLVPGMFPVVMISGHGIEELDHLTWTIIIAWVLTQFAFHYCIAWWLIGSFRPRTSWWPTPRS
jgi:hypothetical protein